MKVQYTRPGCRKLYRYSDGVNKILSWRREKMACSQMWRAKIGKTEQNNYR